MALAWHLASAGLLLTGVSSSSFLWYVLSFGISAVLCIVRLLRPHRFDGSKLFCIHWNATQSVSGCSLGVLRVCSDSTWYLQFYLLLLTGV
jgi:hypothetical protein